MKLFTHSHRIDIQDTKNMKDVSYTIFVIKFTRLPEEIHHFFFVDLKRKVVGRVGDSSHGLLL